jgi:hypothetical protein
MNDNQVNYSHGLAQTKQQVGLCITGALLVHGRSMGIHRLTRLITTQIFYQNDQPFSTLNKQI